VENLFEIIHEDAELLVINKPAGLVCHPTKTDEYSSLIGRVRLHLGKDARPHLVNRLDRETSGVMLVAKTNEAARELRRLMEGREVQKEYLAIVHGHVPDDHGLIDAPLGKDEHSRVAVKDCVRFGGSPSQTEYWVERRFTATASLPPDTAHLTPQAPPSQLSTAAPFSDVHPTSSLSAPKGGEGRGEVGSALNPQPSTIPFSKVHSAIASTLSAHQMGGEGWGEVGSAPSTLNPQPSTLPFTLLRLQPRTGRKHQIRIHLAHIGHPIVGEKIYGGDEDLYLALVEDRLTPEQRQRLIFPYQALHARSVRFRWGCVETEFQCQPEPWFTGFFKD
jgi:23S rRNA-/tRNA-specific pseudouridylate synthase